MSRYLIPVLLVAHAISAADITDAQDVRGMCWELLADSRYGFSHAESAAFVIRSEDGYRCVGWPDSTQHDAARWEGPIPDGTIAIIHTHPNWLPSPSNVDARTARVKGVPVYVITRTKITKTNGNSGEVVVHGDWKPATKRQPCDYASAAAPLVRMTSE